MDYFLKASAVIVIFYCCYKLFLQHETFFQYNRWFLLTGLVLATVLPLVVIPIYIEYTPTPITFIETTSIMPQIQEDVVNNITVLELLFYLYLIGLTYFSGRLIMQFASLKSLLSKQTKIKKEHFYFIETEKDIAPFSFFNRIVFNPKQFAKQELNYIIAHEKTHVNQLHSLDIIITQIATVLFWFNPFIWWYKKEIQQNLEFIADYEAQKEITCSKSYQTVLLKASINQNKLALPNHFYQSLIKKRIIMLQKSKSKNTRQFKLAIVIPFLALFLMSFNVKEIYIAKTINAKTEANIEEFTITSKSSDKDIEAIKDKLEAQNIALKIKFSNVERNTNGEITNLSIETKFEGDIDFTKNITYKHNEGKPIGDIILKVENNELILGSLEHDMNMKVAKNGSTSFITETAASKKEVKTSNGSIYAQNSGDHIILKVDSDKNESGSYKYNIVTEDVGNKKSKLQVANVNKNTLYVVDNEVVSDEKTSFLAMNSEKVESVTVLKGEEATSKYGDKGKNGVVEITTKKTKTNTIKSDDGIFMLTNSKDGNVEIITQDINGNLVKNGTTFTTNSNASSLNSNKNSKTLITTKTTKNGILLNENIKIINDGNLQDTIHFKANNIKFNSSLKNTKPKTLIIIDGKESNIKLTDLDPNKIESMNILKVSSAISLYGAKGKDGVIIITTKKESPWGVSYGVSKVDYKDNATNEKLYIINKSTTNLVLEAYKESLEEDGITLSYSKLRRDKSGNIKSIKIALKDDHGNKSSATWKGNEGGIPTLWIGKSNGSLIASSSYK